MLYLQEKSAAVRANPNYFVRLMRFFSPYYFINNRVPESTFSLDPINFSDEQMRTLYKCVLYSYLAYKDRSIIEFPPEINLEFEKLDSDVNRIPFYIVTDSTINAIVLSCRGSSCLDDFVTDSLGNGVSYDGGKFHQGVFSTASYVFITCQSKLIELNELLNNSTNQENDDENSTSNQNEIDYISSSEIEDNTNEEESKSEEINTSTTTNNSQLNENSQNSISSSSKNYRKMMKNKTKIIITGHSLGAAVAAVVTYLFKEKFPELDVQCICFAPPPTLTFNLWKTTESYIKSFMIEGDPVPFLSVQNIITISDFLIKHEHANKLFKKFVHNYLNKKSIEEYEANSALKEPLYPPGQLYLIKFTAGEEDKSLIEKQKMHLMKKKDELIQKVGDFKKKIEDLNEKIKKKKDKNKMKNDDDDDDDYEDNYLEEDEKVEIKDEQIQLCRVENPEYFTNFVKNVSEKNHFIKNYTRLLVRLLNKNRKSEAHPK